MDRRTWEKVLGATGYASVYAAIGIIATLRLDLGPWLLAALGYWVLVGLLIWAFLRIRELKAGMARANEPVPAAELFLTVPSSGPDFRLVEEIDLLVDGAWAATNPYEFPAGAKVRTAAHGPHRFTLHLVDAQYVVPPRRRKYMPIESTQETMKTVREWVILKAGEYAFIVDPVGNAPFHVEVRVELERKSG